MHLAFNWLGFLDRQRKCAASNRRWCRRLLQPDDCRVASLFEAASTTVIVPFAVCQQHANKGAFDSVINVRNQAIFIAAEGEKNAVTEKVCTAKRFSHLGK